MCVPVPRWRIGDYAADALEEALKEEEEEEEADNEALDEALDEEEEEAYAAAQAEGASDDEEAEAALQEEEEVAVDAVTSPPVYAKDGKLAKTCLACGKGDGKLMRCSRCRSVFFCSRQCQTAAWPAHKQMCIATSTPPTPPPAPSPASGYAPATPPSNPMLPASLDAAVRTRHELGALEARLHELREAGYAALRSGVPSETYRAATVFMDSAEMCGSRRQLIMSAAAGGSTAPPAEAAERTAAAIRDAWRTQSEFHGLAVQCFLRLDALGEANHEASQAVAAARECNDVARLVEATATRANVLLRAAAGGRGGSSSDDAELDGLDAARSELEHAVGLCERETSTSARPAADGPTPNNASALAQDEAMEGNKGAVDYVASAALRRCPLMCAEAVARSALARVLFAHGETDAALSAMSRALALRREHVAARQLIGLSNGPNHTAMLSEARRQLSSTLINFAASVSQASPNGDGGKRRSEVKSALDEALSLARAVGDATNERAALSAIVNLGTDGKGGGRGGGGGGGGGEGGGGGGASAAATELQSALAREGRNVDGACAICLEPLGTTDLYTLRCGHMFHQACSDKWAEQSGKCPSCQRPMSGP